MSAATSQLTEGKQTMEWPVNVPLPESEPELALAGEDGNAYFIIARARRAAREAEWTPEQIPGVQTICESGNYDNVLQTCMRYFDTY